MQLVQPLIDRDRVTVYNGDCREVLAALPEQSVHCCVTSPPYWGLRDYGHDDQIGLEQTPDEYIAEMVRVFREVGRVLRDDGTLWLNIGDTYANDGKWGGSTGGKHASGLHGGGSIGRAKTLTGLKPKELVGIPWRLAFALQADGWYLRQDIIWHKPAPMPESVTDRCTKAHEYIFLLTKSKRYFYDAEAIKEPSTGGAPGNKSHKGKTAYENGHGEHRTKSGLCEVEQVNTRNKRSVWTVNTKPYGGAHFAVFPPELIEPCIMAGTSESGCCSECGAPRVRQIEKHQVALRPGNDSEFGRASDDPSSPYEGHCGSVVGNRDPKRHCTVTKTVGWKDACECQAQTVPCTVLDPFLGSGTTAQVAQELGRAAVGVELNEDYCNLISRRFRQRKLL